MKYLHLDCEVTDIPLPTVFEPFKRLHLPEDNPWRVMHAWQRHKIPINEFVNINFYVQEAGFTLPFHVDDGPIASLNYIVQGNAPISFEDTDVYYKFALLDVQQRHSVPADDTDRIIIKISWMKHSFAEAADICQLILAGRDTITYDELVEELDAATRLATPGDCYLT